MSMSDSDDSGLERVNSEQSSKVCHESVPEDTDFRFKILDCDGSELKRFKFKLKKGKILPYFVPLKGVFKNINILDSKLCFHKVMNSPSLSVCSQRFRVSSLQ